MYCSIILNFYLLYVQYFKNIRYIRTRKCVEQFYNTFLPRVPEKCKIWMYNKIFILVCTMHSYINYILIAKKLSCYLTNTILFKIFRQCSRSVGYIKYFFPKRRCKTLYRCVTLKWLRGRDRVGSEYPILPVSCINVKRT